MSRTMMERSEAAESQGWEVGRPGWRKEGRRSGERHHVACKRSLSDQKETERNGSTGRRAVGLDVQLGKPDEPRLETSSKANKGAAGVDGIDIDSFPELADASEETLAGAFEPS